MTRERLSCALQMEFNNDYCHVVARFGNKDSEGNASFIFVQAYTYDSDIRRKIAERTKSLIPHQFIKAFEWNNRELVIILTMDGKEPPSSSVIEEFTNDNYWPKVTQLAV